MFKLEYAIEHQTFDGVIRRWFTEYYKSKGMALRRLNELNNLVMYEIKKVIHV